LVPPSPGFFFCLPCRRRLFFFWPSFCAPVALLPFFGCPIPPSNVFTCFAPGFIPVAISPQSRFSVLVFFGQIGCDPGVVPKAPPFSPRVSSFLSLRCSLLIALDQPLCFPKPGLPFCKKPFVRCGPPDLFYLPPS